jgi:formate dehydrogenase subunit beta
MSTQWMLKTKGDPLGAVHQFTRDVWQAARLEAMIVPSTGKKQPQVLTNPFRLDEANPFQPLMLMNLAKVIPNVLKEHPAGSVGVMLRPCEARALTEMARRGNFRSERLLTISVDCLGTFPEDEFDWRTARKGTEKGLMGEALQFAPQGGISAYRYRSACQICVSPGAGNADVNIGVLGLPVRQMILVEVKNGGMDWKRITDGEADPDLAARREAMLAKISERNSQTLERVTSGLMEVLPADINALLDQFEKCGACKTCMRGCPICAAAYPHKTKGRYNREDIAGWLASCAGCGMCEQSCPQNLPLSIIFSHVKQKLAESLDFAG